MQQASKLLAATVGVEREYHAALAGVKEKERRARLAPSFGVGSPGRKRPHGTRLVTATRTLDLHHIRPQVAQQLGTKRRRDPFGNVEHPHPGKRRNARLHLTHAKPSTTSAPIYYNARPPDSGR